MNTTNTAVTYAFTECQLVSLLHGRPDNSICLSVQDEAKKLVASLTPEQRAYITDRARGEYRGFAALHDLCDANMLLPLSADDSGVPACNEAYVDFCNAVMAEFDRLIAPLKKGEEIRIKPEWQDEGDDKLKWFAYDDEQNARVGIYTPMPEMAFQPWQTVDAYMVERV